MDVREQDRRIRLHGDPLRSAEILRRRLFDLPFPDARNAFGNSHAQVTEGLADDIFVGRAHLHVGVAAAGPPGPPVQRALQPVGMARRRADESDAAGTDSSHGAEIHRHCRRLVRAVRHPAGAIGSIRREFRHEVLRAPAALVQCVRDLFGRSHGRGRERLEPDPVAAFLHWAQRSDTIHVHLHLPDGTVFVEFQFVDIDLAVGAVAAELQVRQVVVIGIRHVEHTAVAGSEHAGLRIRRAHQVLLRDDVRAQRRDAAHFIVITIALERHIGIEIVIDPLALEEDGAFGVHRRVGRDVDVVRKGDHIPAQAGEIALSPDDVALPVVVDQGLRVDRHLALFPIQAVLRRERVTLDQPERPVRAVGHGRVHESVYGGVGVPFPLVLHRLAGRPVFFVLRLREIRPLETPVDEVSGFPHHGRTGGLQALAIAVRGDVAIEGPVVDDDARISGHVRDQRVAERVVRDGLSVRGLSRTTKGRQEEGSGQQEFSHCKKCVRWIKVVDSSEKTNLQTNGRAFCRVRFL